MPQEKSATIAQRIANDDNYARTRENMAEFGRSVKAGSLLTDAFGEFTAEYSDNKVGNRLTTQFSKIINADVTNLRGSRTIMDGDLQLLLDFEFNSRSRMSRVFKCNCTTTVDRAAGTMGINVPQFSPRRRVKWSRGATHYSLIAYAAEIDFVAGTYVDSMTVSPEMVLRSASQDALILSCNIPVNSPHVLVMAMGVRFYQYVNGKLNDLFTVSHNALSIILVDKP